MAGGCQTCYETNELIPDLTRHYFIVANDMGRSRDSEKKDESALVHNEKERDKEKGFCYLWQYQIITVDLLLQYII